MIWIEGPSRCGSSPAVNDTSLRGVPPETFAAFRAAFAKGRYFNDHIRNNFRYRLVASDSDPG
ncbi:KTSC domain-containing protein [Mesorhizobium sp. M1428]|uniref:KTSC domain-containing protein n=1 Tax=Mesorhizobium sp. M1428 TaxID=2957102 RepID=UPI003334F8AD